MTEVMELNRVSRYEIVALLYPLFLYYSSKVHISTNHRAERDAEYQALSKSLGMKSFPETGFGNFESSLNSLVQNSSSLLHQMSQLQSASPAVGAGVGASSLKFPELSITKHDGPGIKAGEVQDLTSASLQIIPKSSPATMAMASMSSEAGNNYNSCRQEVKSQNIDIQEQINMLRTMPDFMRMHNTNINNEEEDMSGEDMEDEEGSPPPSNIGHKVLKSAKKG